jgi:pimeloyl-ACP methyl ester carboxylesterase
VRSEPETRYVKSGDAHIAYQVLGDGPADLIVVRGYISHLEVAWESPALASFYRRLASFCRLILFDKRGTGLSDRVPEDRLPTLEQRMDDVRAVMDAVGSERAALFGFSEGGPMSILFAAAYPQPHHCARSLRVLCAARLGDRRENRRHCGAHRCVRSSDGRPRRGVGLAHSARSGGGVGSTVRGPRDACAQGGARRLAAVCRRLGHANTRGSSMSELSDVRSQVVVRLAKALAVPLAELLG